MLKHLSIKNYALIDTIEIDFFKGFSAITGETGAGKSIILDALSLLLGQRADTQALMDKNKKCIVEAEILDKNNNTTSFFQKNQLDYSENIIIRREIYPEGKSRSFINDTPVSLNLLKELGDLIIDIHSQHQTRLMNDLDFQLLAIDSYAGITDETKAFEENYTEYCSLKKHYENLLELEKKSTADADYYSFLFNELEQAALKEDEQQELEKELEILTHAELIKTNLHKSLLILNENENNVLQQIYYVQNVLSQISKFDDEINSNTERIASVVVELKDIVSEIEKIAEKIHIHPERLEQINERLNLIYRLQQKHRVGSVSELLDIKNNLSEKLYKITSLEDEIKKLNEQIQTKEKQLYATAQQLSEKRKKVFPEIESKIVRILKDLGMPNARIAIECETLENINATGLDKITFTFSANKGTELKPIARIASGGEQSRLMLAIKSLISRKKLLPTIIFDEIDSGISGEVAAKTGNILKELSADMQVIAITHLPQIAGKSDYHYQVYKIEEKNATFTQIKLLNSDERVEVLAEMLSGNKITEAALKTARQLLS